MTYKELKHIAQPHIRKGDKLPSNAFLLLTQLHIPYKAQKQCEEDFKGKISLLYSTPAFLHIDENGEKTIYFRTNTKYWNFYIFHEIAHFLLGHEDGCPQNEIDADMLACILAAPIENLPSTLKSARDLSALCDIPIDKAEMYWQEIKKDLSKKYKTLFFKPVMLISAFLLLGIFLYSNNVYMPLQKTVDVENAAIDSLPTDLPSQTTDNHTKKSSPIPTPDKTEISGIDERTIYVTTFGEKYHKFDCHYIQGKDNLFEFTIEEAENLGYTACKNCF